MSDYCGQFQRIMSVDLPDALRTQNAHKLEQLKEEVNQIFIAAERASFACSSKKVDTLDHNNPVWVLAQVSCVSDLLSVLTDNAVFFEVLEA